MFGPVYHTGYFTDDLDRAIAFYEKTFNGELIKRAPGRDGSQLAYIKAGDSEVEIVQPADKSKLGGRSGLIIDHVGYFVSDIERSMAELKAKGVKFDGDVYTSAIGYRIVYLDASTTLGTRIHLTQK